MTAKKVAHRDIGKVLLNKAADAALDSTNKAILRIKNDKMRNNSNSVAAKSAQNYSPRYVKKKPPKIVNCHNTNFQIKKVIANSSVDYLEKKLLLLLIRMKLNFTWIYIN